MSDNNKPSNSKNTFYIIGFTAVVLILIFFGVVINAVLNDSDAVATDATGNTVANVQTSAAPEVTSGSFDATIASEIKVVSRDIDFTMSMDEIKEMESGLEDTLDDPTLAQGTDGYQYLTYTSNPENPITIDGIPFASNSAGLAYVFVNDALTEIRFQFGTLDSTQFMALVNGFTNDYGDATFYRSSNGSMTYWWKSDKNWLMITSDTAGVSVHYRLL